MPAEKKFLTMITLSTRISNEVLIMSIEYIKNEVMYYCGLKVSTQEAKEIKAFAEDCPGASLGEIISDYYGC
jgi:hypothetical protein